MDPHVSSSKLVKTQISPKEYEPRSGYIREHQHLRPPWIAHSKFVPPALVEDLMREKKDSAIGVKFEIENSPPDRITTMEGAMHTFVTPIIDATIHGDYQWKNGHSIHKFGSVDGQQLGRRVLVSALVQQDFEDEYIMLRVSSLQEQELIGTSEYPEMIHWYVKQNDSRRQQYNVQIHKYLIYHLTASHKLPSIGSIGKHGNTVPETIDFLTDAIKHTTGGDMLSHIRGRYFRHQGYIISLEVLFMTAVHQNKNEFVALEHLCPKQGYVYTFNPPAIFVRFFGSHGTELLSRIHVAALKYVQSIMKFSACRVISWGDFSDPPIIGLIKRAMSEQPHIHVLSNDTLFRTGMGIKEGTGEGLYRPPKGADAENAILVIHNNSDAFGQNIQTEPSGGSLDGVIGAYSSTSGSLMRHRKDLVKNLLCIK